jgi:hypothetical protein
MFPAIRHKHESLQLHIHSRKRVVGHRRSEDLVHCRPRTTTLCDVRGRIMSASPHTGHAVFRSLKTRPAIESPSIMAPHLAVAQHNLIHDMILDGTLTAAQMATAAGCSTRSVKAIRSNVCHFNATRAPANGGGRRRSITPPMLDALREHLLEKPGLNQEEMDLAF